jgi:hypothetical protein
MRAMVRENIVTPSNFIYPLFIHEHSFNTVIESMPGCECHSLESMLKEVGEAYNSGVKTFVLFPKVPDELKTNYGLEAYNPEGIVPRALRLIKDAYPDSIVCTDVALDPYSDQGHDGVVENGKILNDVTINQLCKQAVCQAKAGSDIIAPSDMMVRFLFVARNNYLRLQNSKPSPHFCYRMAALVLFVMLLTQRASLMFLFLLTQPSMLLLTMDPSVMLWAVTQDLETRRHTNKILPTVEKRLLRLLLTPLKVLTCSWSSPVCHTWILSIV